MFYKTLPSSYILLFPLLYFHTTCCESHFYSCIMVKKKRTFTEQAYTTSLSYLPLLRQCLIYALMITSSELKLLVHALFYVLPIWRKEALRVLTNYYNSSKTLCEDTSKHTFLTEGTLRILSRKLSRKYILKTED